MSLPPGFQNDNAPAANPVQPGQQDVPLATESPAAPPDTTLPSIAPAERPADRDFMKEAMAALRGPRAPMQSQSQAPAASPETSESDPSAAVTGEVPPSAEGGQARKPRTTPSSAAPEPPSTDELRLSQAELDRRVQSEVDRRLAKFQREEAERRKKAEEVDLRRTDPFEYARRMETAEQEQTALQEQIQQLSSYAATHMQAYDQAVLDPLMLKLPAAMHKKLLDENNPEGIPGRARLAQAILGALEKQYRDQGKQDARQALMNDPAFVKEVLARHGGRRVETEPAPAIVGSAPVQFNMDDWMRSSTRR